MATFKEIIESYGKELSFGCTAYKSNGTVYKSITEEDVVSENLRFDGALYTCVMRCLDAVLVGDHRELVKDSRFSACRLTAKKGSDSKTINYGTFYIGEAPEYDEAENTTKFICYDSMYKTTKPYALEGVTFPIELKEYAKKIFTACGLTCANLDDLKNGSKLVTEDRYKNAASDSGSAYTYRDVLDDIAKSAGCSFAFKSNANGDIVDRVYVIYVTDGNGNMKAPLHTLDISNFKSLTIGERYGPANTVVFSRQPQEDNVYLQSSGVTDATAVEVKLTQPLTAEGTDEERETWLPEILNAVRGTEYRCYALESYGIGYLNFGDVFKIKAYKRNGRTFDYDSPEEYLSVFMRCDMMLNGDIKESSKLEMPVATATDYNAAATPGEKKLLQAYMKVNKQLGLIESVVYDPKTGGSRIDQNAEAIKQAVEGVDRIAKAGYITELTAKSLIESNNDKIAMTVAGQLNIGTRNILLDSACFEKIVPGMHYSNLIYRRIYDDSTLPSGKEQTVAFESTRDNGGTLSGITFNSEKIIGQEKGKIDKISSDKVYTLSFWLKGNSTAILDSANLVYVGSGVSVNYIDKSDLTVTNSWKKYRVVFQLSSNPTDFDLRFFFSMQLYQDYTISISSLKLEEGNVATDWTPCVQDTEQFVKAKLELCVKTDENGNLQSAIHAKANQITIESDNFTLDSEGKVTCAGATITNGKIDCNNEYYGVVIENGAISLMNGSTEAATISYGIYDFLVNANTSGIVADEFTFSAKTAGVTGTFNVQGILKANTAKSPEFIMTYGGNDRVTISHSSVKYSWENQAQNRDSIISTGGLYIAAGNSNAMVLDGKTIQLVGEAIFRNTATFNGNIKIPWHIGYTPVVGTNFRFLVVNVENGSVTSVTLDEI